MKGNTAAYRLQLHSLWNFSHAKALVPYLAKLGVDILYLSPILQAKRGSSHCYDMTNPLEINPDLGGEEGYRELVKTAHKHRMDVIVDVVANHMAASIENPWWRDVLENGSNSLYSSFFDIDWKPPHQELQGKILVPYLPMPYHQVLNDGGIRLNLREEGICIEAGFHRLPCNPELYSRIFRRSSLHHSYYRELESVFDKVKKATTDEERKERARFIVQGKELMAKMVVEHSEEVLAELAEINENKTLLAEFLENQYFRLDYWQAGFHYTNYRRFFDINELVALRAEEDHVFSLCHKKLFELYREKMIDGIRVDHPDGLKDPKKYFYRLREGGCTYLIVEKILEKEEPLRNEWCVDGTVGYEYLNALFGLFVRRENEKPFTEIYERFIEKKIEPSRLLYENKREYAIKYMSAEIAALAKRYTPSGISQEAFTLALIDLFAAMPVYRTYVTENETALLDRKYIQEMFDALERFGDPLSDELREFFEGVFLRDCEPRELLYRFQQLSPPIMAKGLEDTHLYRYNRFLSLNEVGGTPHLFGREIADFHEQNREASCHFPRRFTTANTHDTKRSDDVRLRIAAISEYPNEWKEVVTQLSQLTESSKMGPYPDRNFEYFIYQTLVGIMPLTKKRDTALIDRLQAYFLKAARESKQYTNWVNQDDNYERALKHFIENLFESLDTPFWKIFFPFIERCNKISEQTRISSLILRMGSPGIFEIYQGTEFPLFALVDPDNRRAVDYEKRQHALETLEGKTHIPIDIEERKLFYLTRFLRFRKKNEALFDKGEYLELKVEGGEVIAFIRHDQEKNVLFIARRFFSKGSLDPSCMVHLPPQCPQKKWRDLFSNEIHSLLTPFRAKDLLGKNPATVLYSYEL